MLSLPQVVVHRIDGYSPLLTRLGNVQSTRTSSDSTVNDKSPVYSWPEMMLRAADLDAGAREMSQREKESQNDDAKVGTEAKDKDTIKVKRTRSNIQNTLDRSNLEVRIING